MNLLAALRSGPRRWALFALALFVLETLAPALSAFGRVPPPAAFVEVCTSSGMRRIAVNDGSPAAPEKSCFKCPLCATSGGHLSIDKPHRAWVVADVCKFVAPYLAAQQPIAQHGPRPMPARGPPPYS